MMNTPRCWQRRCKHFRGVELGDPSTVEGQETLVCNAFDDVKKGGIPEDIAYGDNLHLEPQPGDQGIVYEQFEGTDREYHDLTARNAQDT